MESLPDKQNVIPSYPVQIFLKILSKIFNFEQRIVLLTIYGVCPKSNLNM